MRMGKIEGHGTDKMKIKEETIYAVLSRIRSRCHIRYDIEIQRIGKSVCYQLVVKDRNNDRILRNIGKVAIGCSNMFAVLKALEDHLILMDDIAREETEMIQSTISQAKDIKVEAYQ